MRWAATLCLLAITTLPVGAMSLSVSVCNQIDDEAATVTCLKEAFDNAASTNTNEFVLALKRVSKATADALSEDQIHFAGALSKDCKVPFSGAFPENVDFGCAIDRLQARTRDLIEVGR